MGRDGEYVDAARSGEGEVGRRGYGRRRRRRERRGRGEEGGWGLGRGRGGNMEGTTRGEDKDNRKMLKIRREERDRLSQLT